MIVAVRVDDCGRCSLDCICVCINMLLLVERAAWHVTFRRHCCHTAVLTGKLESHNLTAVPAKINRHVPLVDHKTKQRLHRFGRTMNCGLLYHPSGSNDKQKATHGTLHTSGRQNAPCQYPAQRAESYWDDRRICTCCFEPFSMQINAGCARWDDPDGEEDQRSRACAPNCMSPRRYIN